MNFDRTARGVTRNKFGYLFAATILLAGCGGSASFDHGSPPPPAGLELKGSLFGGQYPVTGSEVQLYATGSSGYGSGAKALLSPAATTDQDGHFVIPFASFKCPSDSALTYLVATGGDPGLGSNNPAIALMATLGSCGNIGSLPSIVINEVTTVASVWALAPFLGPGEQIGTSSGNSRGLVNAFANVNNLADLGAGATPGLSAPAGAVIPTAKINTLANIVAACINSVGTTACKPLFTAATPKNGSAPTNTLDAALYLARNPSSSVITLFNTPGPNPPFGPALSAAPPDWTLAVNYSGGGLNAPTSIAVDVSGNVWAANYCGSDSPCSSVTELSSTGEPVSTSSGFTGGGELWETYGLAIDISGDVWVTNQQSTGVNSGHGSATVLNSAGTKVSSAGGYFAGGIDFPIALATDTDAGVSGIWIANQADSSASKLTHTGASALSSEPVGMGQLAGPSAVAIDANHNAWFANRFAGSGSVTRISSDGSQIITIASGGNEASGIATDSISTASSSGHVWVANYGTDSVSELLLNNAGSPTVVSSGYTGGGLSYPSGIAVDGIGNVWVANYHGLFNNQGKEQQSTITELLGAGAVTPGKPLSPASGYGADAGLLEPYGIAIDASGSVWVSNFGSNTITQFVGAATPVKTPLVGPAKLP
jgi:hypothetical protein